MSTDPVEVIRVINLPAPAVGPPPMVSNVVADDAGSLLLTDELNHRVLCFDARGALLWAAGSQGAGEGQFRYPRGVCIGWIERGGSREQCIAVADSWNERVGFLDLSGNPLHVWSSHGESPFGQIIDLRYLPAELSELEGTWLLLDHTKHRLLAVTESGAPLFSAGRELPPYLKAGWQVSSLAILRTLREPGVPPDLPPRDHLYYPYRFLGQQPESLMIWEPLARVLKVAMGGSFLSIVQALPGNLEWVAADSSLLLGWEREQSSFYCFDVDGTAHGPWRVDGRPVPSNVSPPECWVQTGAELHRLRLPLAASRPPKPLPLGPGLLALSAARRAAEADPCTARATITALVEKIDELAATAESLTLALDSGTPVDDAHDRKLRAEALQGELVALQEKLLDDLRPHLAPAIDSQYSSVTPGNRLPAGLTEPSRLLSGFLEPLRAAFRLWVKAFDRLRLSILRSQLRQLAGDTMVTPASDTALSVFAALVRAIEWCYAEIGSGGSKGTGGCVSSAWEDESPSAGPTLRSDVRVGGVSGTVRRPLRETARMRISAGGGRAPAKPFGMCGLADGRFLVSLLDGHEVQCLDEHGKVVMRLGEAGSGPGKLLHPTGVLFDACSRVWVGEAGNRRIQVWSPPYDRTSTTLIGGSPGEPLEGPGGLIQLSCGDVLVADSLADRIWRVGARADLELWPGRAESDALGLSNPVSFARVLSGEAEGIWLVDRANHRLLRLNESGRCEATVGSCGLEDSDWLAPRAVACFEDGTMVVAEDRDPGCLVFLTGDGRVSARMPLDYVPGTLIARGPVLLVADILGDSIRVYERV